MFDSFNRHRYQSLKLSKLAADMVQLVEILGPVTGVIFRFRGAKGCEFNTVPYGH